MFSVFLHLNKFKQNKRKSKKEHMNMIFDEIKVSQYFAAAIIRRRQVANFGRRSKILEHLFWEATSDF